jgi:hypothetical protein
VAIFFVGVLGVAGGLFHNLTAMMIIPLVGILAFALGSLVAEQKAL